MSVKRMSTVNGCALVAVLTGASPLLAQGGGSDLVDVNLGLSIWTVVIFVGLVFVLRAYAFGPILSAAREREEGIQRAIDEAAANRAEATELLAEHRARLAEARREAQDIIADGKAAGQEVRKEIEEKAREEAQKILERARAEIQREKDAAIADLRRESVDLAIAAATKLMDKNLDSEKDRRLVSDWVDRLSGAEGRSAEA